MFLKYQNAIELTKYFGTIFILLNSHENVL